MERFEINEKGFEFEDWMTAYSEKQLHRIDELHSSRMPLSEWTDEDLELYVRFERDDAAAKAKQDEKIQTEIELMKKNFEMKNLFCQ